MGGVPIGQTDRSDDLIGGAGAGSDAVEMQRACDEAEAAGADAAFIAAVRQQAKLIRAAVSMLDEMYAGSDAAEMERACEEAESAGVDVGRITIQQHTGRLGSSLYAPKLVYLDE